MPPSKSEIPPPPPVESREARKDPPKDAEVIVSPPEPVPKSEVPPALAAEKIEAPTVKAPQPFPWRKHLPTAIACSCGLLLGIVAMLMMRPAPPSLIVPVEIHRFENPLRALHGRVDQHEQELQYLRRKQQ